MTHISFKDFIAITEGKNIGVLYHFTRLSSLLSIVQRGFLISHMDYISFTRNFEMTSSKYKNDLNFNIGDPRGVRIAIDGTKLSNFYRIAPYIDIHHGVTRDNGEAEERIDADRVNILKCIKQIDVMGSDEESMKHIIKLLDAHDIKMNFVNTWTKVK